MLDLGAKSVTIVNSSFSYEHPEFKKHQKQRVRVVSPSNITPPIGKFRVIFYDRFCHENRFNQGESGNEKVLH